MVPQAGHRQHDVRDRRLPHPTCLYPGALNYLAEATSRFTPEERIKVLGANAARLYNLPAAAAVI